MKKLIGFILPVCLILMSVASGGDAFGQSENKDLILFGRGLYPGNDSSFDMIRRSGFTTLILSSFYIRANGDVYSGDDHRNPIIRNGEFIGNPDWIKRIRSLKKDSSSIRRIEILLEGRWYNQPPNTYDFIQSWMDSGSTGNSSGSPLYGIIRLMKEKIGADAICIDDESVYDASSIIRLGRIAEDIGMHMSLCPFTNIPFWKKIIDSSRRQTVDAVYLQCYDGGAKNTATPWVNGLQSDTPLYPIFLCRGSFGTCGTSHNSRTPQEISADVRTFKKAYPDLRGAGIWQIQDIRSYVRLKCASQDPASGNATTAAQYLDQLKGSIQDNL